MECATTLLLYTSIGFFCVDAAGLIDGCFVAGGCSVDYNGPGCDESADGEVVRAVLWPGCVVARPIPGRPKATTLQWLLDIDYKGWAPRCLLDWTVPFAQVVFDSTKLFSLFFNLGKASEEETSKS